MSWLDGAPIFSAAVGENIEDFISRYLVYSKLNQWDAELMCGALILCLFGRAKMWYDHYILVDGKSHVGDWNYLCSSMIKHFRIREDPAMLYYRLMNTRQGVRECVSKYSDRVFSLVDRIDKTNQLQASVCSSPSVPLVPVDVHAVTSVIVNSRDESRPSFPDSPISFDTTPSIPTPVPSSPCAMEPVPPTDGLVVSESFLAASPHSTCADPILSSDDLVPSRSSPAVSSLLIPAESFSTCFGLSVDSPVSFDSCPDSPVSVTSLSRSLISSPVSLGYVTSASNTLTSSYFDLLPECFNSVLSPLSGSIFSAPPLFDTNYPVYDRGKCILIH
jgi:hypothetical protein